MALPDKVLTNADLEKIVDTSDEWITSRTGIKERRVLSDGERLSELVVKAAREALNSASLIIDDIDLIIGATFTSDYQLPSGACQLHYHLGAKRPIPAFDLAAACSGWVYGLEVASNFIQSGNYRNILLTGADALSPFLNWKDRTTCVLFGDGAGATIISPTQNSKAGLRYTDWGAWGKYGDILKTEGGKSALPGHRLLENPSQRENFFVQMAGREVFKVVSPMVVESIRRVLKKTEFSMDQMDIFVPHQANLRMIKFIIEKLAYPIEKVGITLQKYGNSSAGTIPITLYECVMEGRIKKGDKVLFSAFGGGLTYASSLLIWD